MLRSPFPTLVSVVSVVSVASVAVACGLGGAAITAGCATSQNAYFGDEGGLQEGGAGEGGVSGEGGERPGAERIPCGPTFCRSDARCVSNACTYDCTGTKVPGDYATITAAVTALAATGSDVNICLGAIQAGESVSIVDPAAHKKSLKIVATAPLLTTLGSVSVGAGFSEVTLVGFGTSASMTVQGAAKVTLRGLKLSAVSGPALQLRAASTTTPSLIAVDGCDVGSTSTSGYGIYIDSSLATPFNVTINNSYIHGGQYGVYLAGSTSGTTTSALSLIVANNTIDKAGYGIFLSGSPTSVVSYFNNIVAHSTMVGVSVATGMTMVTHERNALFGNTTNYGGGAVEGTGYVKDDCGLDATATGVPQLKVGSPCRGVGKVDGAPPTDFWNADRGAKIDLGAVQGP